MPSARMCGGLSKPRPVAASGRFVDCARAARIASTGFGQAAGGRRRHPLGPLAEPRWGRPDNWQQEVVAPFRSLSEGPGTRTPRRGRLDKPLLLYAGASSLGSACGGAILFTDGTSVPLGAGAGRGFCCFGNRSAWPDNFLQPASSRGQPRRGQRGEVATPSPTGGRNKRGVRGPRGRGAPATADAMPRNGVAYCTHRTSSRRAWGQTWIRFRPGLSALCFLTGGVLRGVTPASGVAGNKSWE